MNKILKVLKNNLGILIVLMLFILLCVIVKNNYMDIVNRVDNSVHNFFVNKTLSPSNTEFMKNITYLGSTVAVISIFILMLLFLKNKIMKVILSLDMAFLYLIRTGLKDTFRRPRPDYSLITLPRDFSFPSGHTLFSVGFYGLIIYFIWKLNINKIIKYILTFIISILIILICASRLYLGVHYFSDVLAGFILGILSIILFIGIYKNYDWKWMK